MTTETATDAANQAMTTFGKIASTIRGQEVIRAMITASAETNAAEMDLGTKMADGARGIVIIIETATEAAIETAIETAILISGADTENLAKVIVVRYPVQRHGVLIAPLGHPSLLLTKLGTPSVGVPGNIEGPALVPDDPEVPADAPAST